MKHADNKGRRSMQNNTAQQQMASATPPRFQALRRALAEGKLEDVAQLPRRRSNVSDMSALSWEEMGRAGSSATVHDQRRRKA